MKLNNFEKQTQQKLNNREIKPSANSWDRLDAMLSVEEKPKKKGFFWINIAASFIVFASIGYYFYNQNQVVEPVKEESIIVGVEKKAESSEQNSEDREEKIYESVQSSVVSVQSENEEKSNQKPLNTSIITNQKGVSNTNQSPIKESIVASEINNQQSTVNNKYVSAEKLLAEVSDKDFESKTIGDKELKKSKRGISVNANSLLSNAETELNQTYRESALEKLNRNFNSVKTVLANRNYED